METILKFYKLINLYKIKSFNLNNYINFRIVSSITCTIKPQKISITCHKWQPKGAVLQSDIETRL